MYNRYVPGNDGIYRRQTVLPQNLPQKPQEVVKDTCEDDVKIAQQQRRHRQNQTDGFDLGDLLLLCIIVLLMVDCEDEDNLPLLITVAALLFLQ